MPNTIGVISHCKKGVMIEVKYINNKAGAAAEWMKVKGEAVKEN